MAGQNAEDKRREYKEPYQNSAHDDAFHLIRMREVERRYREVRTRGRTGQHSRDDAVWKQEESQLRLNKM